MKKKKEELENLFSKFQNQWDFEDLDDEHEKRFLLKLKQNQKNKKKNYWFPISIAATVLIMLGFVMFYHPLDGKPENLKFASAQTREADSVFNSIINLELQKLKSDDSPANKIIIADALNQMQKMDADYEKIKQELIRNGESKQIIYAMISNLQMRISFLENVMKQIEKNNNFINKISDEKTI